MGDPKEDTVIWARLYLKGQPVASPAGVVMHVVFPQDGRADIRADAIEYYHRETGRVFLRRTFAEEFCTNGRLEVNAAYLGESSIGEVA